MPDVRTYRLCDERCIVKVRGDLDSAAVAAIAGTAHAIDLRDAVIVDLDALDELVARTDAIFIAVHPVREALEVIGLHRPVRTASSLSAALH